MSRDIASEDDEPLSCRRIEQVYQAQGPAIMASWLQDIYLKLRLSSEAARLLVREQGLDSQKDLEYSQTKMLILSIMW